MADDWENSSADDDFGYDGESFGEEQLNKKGSAQTVDKEGMYHFDISEVTPELDTLTKDGKPKAAQIRFDMTVMKTVPGQSPAGHKLFHRISLRRKDGQPPKEGSITAALCLGVAAGVLEVIKKEGRSVTVMKGTTNSKLHHSLWQQLKGRQVIGKVKFEKGTDGYQDKYAVPYGDFWDPRDPEVASVPKDADALAAIGVTAAPAVATPPAANGQAAAPRQAAAPAGYDDLGDL